MHFLDCEHVAISAYEWVLITEPRDPAKRSLPQASSGIQEGKEVVGISALAHKTFAQK